MKTKWEANKNVYFTDITLRHIADYFHENILKMLNILFLIYVYFYWYYG